MNNLLPEEIQIFGTYDRGVPNLERVVLRVNRSTNLASYLLLFGYRAQMGVDSVIPIPDQSLWLGSTFIAAPCWIFVYTGKGTTTVTQEANTKEPAHFLYWNKPQVVMTHNDIVPALVHVDFVQIGNKPNLSLTDIVNKPLDNSMSLSEIFRQITPGA